jgi:hypothetical protein
MKLSNMRFAIVWATGMAWVTLAIWLLVRVRVPGDADQEGVPPARATVGEPGGFEVTRRTRPIRGGQEKLVEACEAIADGETVWRAKRVGQHGSLPADFDLSRRYFAVRRWGDVAYVLYSDRFDFRVAVAVKLSGEWTAQADSAVDVGMLPFECREAALVDSDGPVLRISPKERRKPDLRFRVVASGMSVSTQSMPSEPPEEQPSSEGQRE